MTVYIRPLHDGRSLKRIVPVMAIKSAYHSQFAIRVCDSYTALFSFYSSLLHLIGHRRQVAAHSTCALCYQAPTASMSPYPLYPVLHLDNTNAEFLPPVVDRPHSRRLISFPDLPLRVMVGCTAARISIFVIDQLSKGQHKRYRPPSL